MERPLEGISVIELTHWIQGPLAGQLLADMGAEVLKIERPGEGDGARGLVTLYGARVDGQPGHSLVFDLCNRNKKSLTIDIGKDEGRAALRLLLERADVFLTNLRPGALASNGLSPEALHAFNPGLVYALGSGLGVV